MFPPNFSMRAKQGAQEELDIRIPPSLNDRNPSTMPVLRSNPINFEFLGMARLDLEQITNPQAEESKKISTELVEMRDRLKAMNDELRQLEREKSTLGVNARSVQEAEHLRVQLQTRIAQQNQIMAERQRVAEALERSRQNQTRTPNYGYSQPQTPRNEATTYSQLGPVSTIQAQPTSYDYYNPPSTGVSGGYGTLSQAANTFFAGGAEPAAKTQTSLAPENFFSF